MCVCVVKHPIIGHIEMECLVGLANLFDSILQFRNIITDLLRDQKSCRIIQALCW